MSRRDPLDQSISRIMARAVLFIVFIGAGISLALTFIGQGELVLTVAIITAFVAIGVLIGGAILVARTKK